MDKPIEIPQAILDLLEAAKEDPALVAGADQFASKSKNMAAGLISDYVQSEVEYAKGLYDQGRARSIRRSLAIKCFNDEESGGVITALLMMLSEILYQAWGGDDWVKVYDCLNDPNLPLLPGGKLPDDFEELVRLNKTVQETAPEGTAS